VSLKKIYELGHKIQETQERSMIENEQIKEIQLFPKYT
jgi:hypothetical protein